ncbi:DUF4198 domain-containing protein [Hyphomonas sp.]|uniref:DUF4198 domain-containing protein n=1 Tax=Hyphomonas sp. TaxID=87 RepID=UPI0025BD6DDF|nr:DUF4198 domain-containing protein [Hyphomonas sp.]
MVLASTAAAHDFWLQPDTFTPEGGAILGVTAKVGHSDDISEWPADPARIIAFRSIGESGIEDIQAALGNRHSEGRFDVATGEPGFYVLAIESIPSVSELPAEKFNTYVTDEGVRPIAIHRMENGLTETSGREIYSRRAKSIIRVGDAGAAGDAHLLRPIGMTLEVTPLANPALLEPGSGLPVEVRYRGSPLPGAMLHVVNLDPEIGDVDKVVTGADGRAVLSNLAEGRWMLQTVWSAPISGDVRGDYDTIFSSLTFEVLGTAAEGESAAMPGVNN